MGKINSENLTYYNQLLDNLNLIESLEMVLDNVEGERVFSTSFGVEDQVLIHFLSPHFENIKVFTLDTGRQFNETYEVFQRTLNKYRELNIQTYFPEENDIANYVSEFGINGFYESIGNRTKCCYIRKVKPLKRALNGATLWITGLRAEQSTNRETMKFLEWDEDNRIIKFNPLMKFSLTELEKLVDQFSIPISSLYKKGYKSIGCAPCTRAIEPEEDFRAGRWWWENGKKECGLHIHIDNNK